jgi:hypothetical protein
VTQQSESWRLLIVSRHGSDILLNSSATGFELPRILIPGNQRIAAGIVLGAEEQLGLRVVALYEIFPPGQSDPVAESYHAAVSHCTSQSALKGLFWTPIDSVLADSHLSGDDRLAVQALWSKWETTKSDPLAEPFAQPGWFAEVTDWIAKSLDKDSMFLTGSFRQLNASSTFSLIRFDTNSKPVWFKAVGEPNTREFAVTLALARICPAHLPRVIASESAWNAWLAEEAGGTSLAVATCAMAWQTAAVGFARLQLLARSELHMIPEYEVRDLRSRRLLSLVPRFFERMEACQAAAGFCGEELPPATDLPALRDTVIDTLTALEGLDIPDTIGHMDLNPHNIFCSDSGNVFLDWAEAFIGCPLFSFEYLVQHFRRTPFAASSSEEDLRNSYLACWGCLLPAENIHAATRLIPLAALFAYAATLCDDIFSHPSPLPTQRRYLLQLLRKMNRMSHQPKEVCA